MKTTNRTNMKTTKPAGGKAQKPKSTEEGPEIREPLRIIGVRLSPAGHTIRAWAPERAGKEDPPPLFEVLLDKEFSGDPRIVIAILDEIVEDKGARLMMDKPIGVADLNGITVYSYLQQVWSSRVPGHYFDKADRRIRKSYYAVVITYLPRGATERVTLEWSREIELI